ncbi:hypothetical protein AHAS_Ahas13G0338900 [Arachis hypogaea]
MIDASPFSSLDHATSFARQLWFQESRIQLWLDAFSGHLHLTDAIGHAPASMKKTHYENTFIVELDIAAREEFKLIEYGLSQDKIQQTSEKPGEVVPYSIEKEDVVSDSSDETDSTGRNTFMLSYDLDKTLEENEFSYSGMSPEKKSVWHLSM